MTSAHAPGGGAERDAKAVERLVLFTDAVVAIIITLMVLEVKLPVLPHHVGDALLGEALAALWPKYLAVGVSFLVVGVFWAAHHRRFGWVSRVSTLVVWLNLIFLLLLATIPFVTAVLAEHPGRLSTILYAADVDIVALCAMLLWWTLSREELIAGNPAAKLEMQTGAVGAALTALLFLGSIGIALVSPTAARYSWILLFIANYLSRRLYRKYSEKQKAPVGAAPAGETKIAAE